MDNDTFSNLISFVGIVVSLISAGVVYRYTKKHDKILIKKDYFDKIFFDLLFEEFPKDIETLRIENDRFLTDELNKINTNLKLINNKIHFFKYYDSDKTYHEIKRVCKEFQDKLFEIYGFNISDININERNKEIIRKKSELSEKYKRLCDEMVKYVYR